MTVCAGLFSGALDAALHVGHRVRHVRAPPKPPRPQIASFLETRQFSSAISPAALHRLQFPNGDESDESDDDDGGDSGDGPDPASDNGATGGGAVSMSFALPFLVGGDPGRRQPINLSWLFGLFARSLSVGRDAFYSYIGATIARDFLLARLHNIPGISQFLADAAAVHAKGCNLIRLRAHADLFLSPAGRRCATQLIKCDF